MFLSKKISIKNIQMRKIVSQAIELMSTEEIKSNIQILDNGGFDISNQTTKEQLKAYLVKLVRRIRQLHSYNRCRKRKRDKVDSYPSRTKNILISPSGLKKRRENNERQKRQRARKRAKETESTFVWLNPSDVKQEMDDVDAMRLHCLQHGGHTMNKNDWGVKGISDAERKTRQENYRKWKSNLSKSPKKIQPLNITNLSNFNLTDTIKRNAHVAMVQFEHKMRNITTCVCQSCLEWVMLDYFREDFICSKCKVDKRTKTYFLENNYQPIWKDENDRVQYSVPKELKTLTLQEELVIQKNSPYIPVVHVHHGSLGLKGHCIMFERKSEGDVSKLPRCVSDTVCFMRQYGSKSSGKDQKQMSVKVNKAAVITSLTTLKKIHKSYTDINIEEPPDKTQNVNVVTLDKSFCDNERNVSSAYCHDDITTDVTYSSVAANAPTVSSNRKKAAFVESLKKCVKDNNVSVSTFDFPPSKNEPLRYVHGLTLTNYDMKTISQ